MRKNAWGAIRRLSGTGVVRSVSSDGAARTWALD